jgi:hypothetical protein
MNLNRLKRMMWVGKGDCVRLQVIRLGMFHRQHQRHFIVVILLRNVEIRWVVVMMILSRYNLSRHQIPALVNLHRCLSICRLSFVVLPLLALGFRRCRFLMVLLNDAAHDHLVMMSLLVGVNNFILYVQFDSWNERFRRNFILNYHLTTVRLHVVDLIHQKVEILHVFNERHGLFEGALLNPIRHFFRVANRLALSISLRSVRCIYVWRFLFVDLILLQQRVAVFHDVLELIEDNKIGIAVGTNYLGKWIVCKYLKERRFI